MARKEFLKEDNLDFSKLDAGLEPSGEIKPKMSVFLSRIFSVIKLILGFCLLTFVYAGSVGFLKELSLVEKSIQDYFWSGVISFVILYFFVYEPARIYQKGQRLLTLIFKFFAPLVRFAPYVLPIYTIIVFTLYPLCYAIFNKKETAVSAITLTHYFIFLGSFSLVLHLVFSAKSLRSRQGDFLKSNYIFGFSLIYILNLLLIAMCLSMIVDKFSFVNFFNASFLGAKEIFRAAFKQIFVP